ncbi:hypothetical protein B0H11DRAFT_524099 [Mycena galericulata]|nr:hypothetical protein B0H11DRAFT_524099 [Mycena galericulata]
MPILDNPLHAAVSRDTDNPVSPNFERSPALAAQNFRGILGIDEVPEPEKLAQLQSLAQVAEAQAHAAYEVFTKELEAQKQKWDAARKNSKPKPFELKMGRREEDGGTGRQPAEQADAEQVAVAVPITPKLPPPFIRDNGESPPTPTISELDANLESIGYTPISFTLGDSSFATPAGERVIREVHVNGNIGVVITEDYDDADEALPEVPSDCTSDTTDEFIQIVTEATGIQPRWDLRDGTDSEMGQALFYWVDSQMGREDASRQWETAQVGESWERARQLIYGPLRTLLDFNRMAAESFHRRSSLLVGSPSSDTAPNISQSPTSLDFSLPSSAPVPYSSFPTCTNIDERNAGLGASNSGDKRKPSNSEPSSPEPPHKRFSAQLAEPEILGQLAGARRYILYGAQCVQDMLVRERADFRAATQRYLDENGWIIDYGLSPPRFTATTRPGHALLLDYETAKLRIIHSILQERHYPGLAWALNDILRLRFRDEYALASLLSAGYLEAYPPEASSPEYWQMGNSDSSDNSPGRDSLGYPSDHASNGDCSASAIAVDTPAEPHARINPDDAGGLGNSSSPASREFAPPRDTGHSGGHSDELLPEYSPPCFRFPPECFRPVLRGGVTAVH